MAAFEGARYIARVLNANPCALAVALATWIAGCEGTPSQTVLRFAASPELAVPEGATLSLEVWGDGVRQHEAGQTRGPHPFTPDIKLVVDALDDDADRRFTVFAELRDPSGARVSWARVRTGFVRDRLSEVRIHFAPGCPAPPDRVEQNADYDPEATCGSHDTCIAAGPLGACTASCYAPESFGGSIAVPSAPIECPAPDCLAIDRVVAGWDNTCALSNGEAFCWGRTSFRDQWRSRPSRVFDRGLRARPSEAVADIVLHVHQICALDPMGALRCGGSGSNVALTDHVTGYVPCCAAELTAPPFSSIVTGGGWIAGVTTAEGEIWYTGAHPVSGGIAGEMGGPFRTFRDQTGFEVLYAGRNFLAGFRGGAFVWFDRAVAPPLRPDERQITAAGRALCAISGSDGRLLCWGESPEGVAYAAEPADLGTGFTRVALSSYIATDASGPIPQHRCAIREDGSLVCWGSNRDGQLGVDPTVTPSSPEGEGTRVGALGDWTDVTVGRAHSCGVHSDGSLSCWGSATFGQIGTGGASTFAPSAVCVPSF
jgi:hypothetical protein